MSDSPFGNDQQTVPGGGDPGGGSPNYPGNPGGSGVCPPGYHHAPGGGPDSPCIPDQQGGGGAAKCTGAGSTYRPPPKDDCECSGGPEGPGTCPPGQGSWCDLHSGTWKCAPNGSATGGGGGGGGAGGAHGGGGGTTPDATDFSDFASYMRDYLKNILSGNDVPYTPGVISNLEGSAFSASQGGLQRTTQGLYNDAARRGVFRSPFLSDPIQAAQSQASAAYGTEKGNIERQAQLENYNARMSALDKAQKWLDSQMDYALRKEMNQIERDRLIATIKLGYAQIQAQKDMLNMQLQNSVLLATIPH